MLLVEKEEEEEPALPSKEGQMKQLETRFNRQRRVDLAGSPSALGS